MMSNNSGDTSNTMDLIRRLDTACTDPICPPELLRNVADAKEDLLRVSLAYNAAKAAFRRSVEENKDNIFKILDLKDKRNDVVTHITKLRKKDSDSKSKLQRLRAELSELGEYTDTDSSSSDDENSDDEISDDEYSDDDWLNREIIEDILDMTSDE